MKQLGKGRSKLLYLFLLFCLGAFDGYGQSFLQRYPRITKKNLPEFIQDWDVFSQTVKRNCVVMDSVVNKLFEIEFLSIYRNRQRSELGRIPTVGAIEETFNGKKFVVTKEYVNSRRFIINNRFVVVPKEVIVSYYAVPYSLGKISASPVRIRRCTPTLDSVNVLYFTDSIFMKLENYIGGKMKINRFTNVNMNRFLLLRDYIPINTGHWGGWSLNTFPIIHEIKVFTNGVLFSHSHGSWHGGDYWYELKDGVYIRKEEPVDWWMS